MIRQEVWPRAPKALMQFWRPCPSKPERQYDVADRQRHVLFAIGKVADGRRIYPLIPGEMPQTLTGPCIQRKHDSFQRSAEDQISVGRHDTTPWGREHF